MLTSLFSVLAATPLESALRAELDRAMTGLHLPTAPPPCLIQYDVLEGNVVTFESSFGLSISDQRERYRSLRTEVRVGSYAMDSSNFNAVGEPDGIVQDTLPVEDSELALRRRIWLSTDEAYKAAVEQFSRKQAARGDNRQPRSPDYTPAPPVHVEASVLPEVPRIDADRLWTLSDRLSGALLGVRSLEEASAAVREWQGRRLTLTSEGTSMWRNTGFIVIRVKAAIRLPDGTRAWDARSWIARSAALLPDEAEMLAAVKEMGQWLDRLQTAPVEEDYLGPVLFEDQAAVELFAQLLPAEMIGTPPMEQPDDQVLTRLPTARLGRRLLPTGWTVTDDPTDPRPVLGNYSYDMEGVAPRPVAVVVDGVVRDLLMSRLPSRDRTQSTGHARSLGADRRAALPSVVTVKPPRSRTHPTLRRQALRLAKQVGHGYVLVIRSMEPAALVESIDIAISGDAPLPGLTRPMEVYRLYADGREEPVRPMEFVGVDRRVLRDIYAAGPLIGPVDLLDGPPGPDRFQIGPTGGIGVTWTVPEVLITEMELNGRRGGEPRVLQIP